MDDFNDYINNFLNEGSAPNINLKSTEMNLSKRLSKILGVRVDLPLKYDGKIITGTSKDMSRYVPFRLFKYLAVQVYNNEPLRGGGWLMNIQWSWRDEDGKQGSSLISHFEFDEMGIIQQEYKTI